MDFPLPIRSFTSTMDFSTPLFVDTNIIYQIDEMKFPGIQDISHYLEPALIFESDITSNSNITCTEVSDTTITTCDEGNEDLYNLIESLDTEDTTCFPFGTVNILDLPDIQLDLQKEEMSDISFAELWSADNVPIRLNCVPVESSYLFSMNNDKAFEEFQPCEDTEPSTCNTYLETPSCRFPNSRRSLSRKRRLSAAPQHDVFTSTQTDQFLSTKRRKLDLHELYLNDYSIGNSFDCAVEENLSRSSFYSDNEQTTEFNFCESTANGLSDRQC